MTDTVRILKAARDLIAKPENWTQATFARDANGHPVRELDEDAICFCAYGAVFRVSGVHGTSAPTGILINQVGGSLADFNDSHTHAEVLSLFSKAITAAEEAER